MITDKDIQKLKNVFLTREDGVTKSEFHKEINKLETRLDNVDIRLDKVETRLDNMEIKLDKFQDKLSEVGSLMRRILKELTDMRTELKLVIYRLGEHDQWIIKAAKKIAIPYNP
jgi:chromosome segregation ATPase